MRTVQEILDDMEKVLQRMKEQEKERMAILLEQAKATIILSGVNNNETNKS